MDEGRRFNRVCFQEHRKGTILYADQRDEVNILDLSAGGMRIASYRPIPLGEDISGEFRVLPQGGPFFVRGRVTRITENNGAWEAVVQFDRVSTIPLG
jgi:hypothetical protein